MGSHVELGPAGAADLGISGFEDAELIGRGGFGSVYRATQTALDRIVAVKVLSIPGIRDDTKQRFERECRAVGALSGHPHIVTVYDCGFNEWGRPYIVMDHMARGSLADLVAQEGPVAWPDSVSVGIKLAGAIATSHAAGILHRDIKPENVLLSSYGEPKVADFGISSISGDSHTTSGAITASLSHAAPELLDGATASVRSDVYALASTVFTLIAGEAPFGRGPDESIASLIARIATAPPPDLRPRGVPDAVCKVLETCLAKDPAARIASATAFGDALRAAQEEQGVNATPMVIDPEHSLEAADAYALVDRFLPGGGSGTSRTKARPRRVLTPPPPATETPRAWYQKPAVALAAVVTLLAATATAVALTRDRDPVAPETSPTPAAEQTVADNTGSATDKKKPGSNRNRRQRGDRDRRAGSSSGGVTGSFSAPSGSFGSSSSGSAPAGGTSQGTAGSGSGNGGSQPEKEKPPPPPPPPPPDDMLFLLKHKRTGEFYMTLSSADAHIKSDGDDARWRLTEVGYVYETPLEGKRMNALNLDDGDTAYALTEYSAETGSTRQLFYASNGSDHVFTTNFNQAASLGSGVQEAGWVRAP